MLSSIIHRATLLAAAVAAYVAAAFTHLSRVARARGQGLVEYGLILSLIVVVAFGALITTGKKAEDIFEYVNCNLGGAYSHTDNGQGKSNRCD